MKGTPDSEKPPAQEPDFCPLFVKVPRGFDQQVLFQGLKDQGDLLLKAEHHDIIYVGYQDYHVLRVKVDVGVGFQPREANLKQNPCKVVLP